MKFLTLLQDRRPVVAHINYHFFAPSETFIYFYLSNFQRVHPICLNWSTPIQNIDLFPFPRRDCYSYFIPPVKRYTLLWLLRGIRRRMERFLWPFPRERTVDRINWAKSILRKRNACLIHAHFGPMGWQVLPLKRELKLPLITTFYGFDVAPQIKWLGPEWPQRRQELFEEGDLFLVEGPFMRQRLIDLGCPPEKVQIQRIAIKVKNYPYRPRKPRADGKTIIMFAGRFCEKKGLIYALQAVGEVYKIKPNIEFRIIGDGELAPEIQAFIRNNNMENYVQLLGFLSHKDYLREMEMADIFLHPSVTAADGDSEGGAPTAILEAQALGMPIVSTYHADIPNVTLPGKSALLVPERDTQALIDVLLYLLNHPEKWEEMSQAGRNYVEKFHDIDYNVAQLEEKYFALISRYKKQSYL